MFIVEKYKDFEEKEWDDFVLNDSVNGTFLQTRRFLNYHPKGRFEDASFIIRDKKGTIAAVCPACEIIESDKKVLYSHKGSTFGGLIIRGKYYNTKKLIEIIDSTDTFCIENRYKKVIFKITPDLFAKESSNLLEYCLEYSNYENYSDLSTFIDYKNYKESIVSNFTQGKRTNVNNCLKKDLKFKQLLSEKEI